MKRFLFILLILPLFSGCFLFNSFGRGDDKEVSTTVDVQYPGDVFLVKLNVSDDIVKAAKTGYVSGTSRSAVEAEKEYDTDRFIRNLNNDTNKALFDYLSSADRSADRAAAKASGWSTREFGQTEEFWSFVNTDNSDNNIAGKITATKKNENDYCYVYADSRLTSSEITQKCIDLGQKFADCYLKETQIIGNPQYKDYNSDFYNPCNQKIVILVSDLFGDAKENQKEGTVGYFYSGDLLKQSLLDRIQNVGLSESSVYYTHSNGCEIFYIDSQFLLERTDSVYSTLVHEFNHMINYVVKTLNKMTSQSDYKKIFTDFACEVWFTEMLAMTTEDMFQNYLGIKDADSPKSRLPYFGLCYNYGFTSWDDDKVASVIMYANTYAFGAFLARNFGGVDLIKQIAQNDYVNEMAITKALQTLDPNTTYKDEKTGLTKHIDCTYALRKFTLCIVNTGRDEVYSLNRATAFKNDLGFKPIDINTTVTYEGTTYSVPVTFKANQDGQLDIYPTGFTVHYVGRNLSSFSFCTTNMDDLEYYVVQ